MRFLPPLLLLMLAVPAGAQDACTEDQPCPWVVDVDEDGLHGDDLNATVGDWYLIEVLNLDTEDHTLTLEGHGVTLDVPAGTEVHSDPIAFDTVGTYTLEDQPSGETLWLEVRATDVVDDETGGDAAGDQDTPLPPAVLLGALAVALVLRRR